MQINCNIYISHKYIYIYIYSVYIQAYFVSFVIAPGEVRPVDKNVAEKLLMQVCQSY